ELCQHRIEKTTDQYSLALTYYHLRTGQPATGALADIPEILQAHLHGRLKFEGLSDTEAAVLRRATSIEPHERFPSCLAFVSALQASLSGVHWKDGLPEPVDTAGGAGSTRKDMPGSPTVKSDPRISVVELPRSMAGS